MSESVRDRPRDRSPDQGGESHRGNRTNVRTYGLTKKDLTTRDKLTLSIARDERGQR